MVNLNLAESVDPDNTLEVAPYMAKAAILALSQPEFKLPAGKSREQMVEAVLAGLFKGLGENSGYGLTAADQTQLLQKFVGSAALGSGESALLTDKSAAFTSLCRSMIASLTLTKITKEQLPDIVTSIMKEAVSSIKGAGISEFADIQTTLTAATRAALAAMAAGGITDRTVSDQVAKAVSRGAISGLAALSLTDEQQSVLSAKVAEGVAQGLADAGYSAFEIDTIKSNIDQEITTALEENGVTTSAIESAQTAAQQKIDGIISELGGLGI
jgi:hypothetical protein